MAKIDLNAVVSASRAWQRSYLAQSAAAAAAVSMPVPASACSTSPALSVWTPAAIGPCLAELSGIGAAASLTLAFSLVWQAQQQGEPVAWIARVESTFFPPDVANRGIDLGGLPVIQLASTQQCVRAAEQLARSGAFGLVVIDLGECLDLSRAAQARLAAQALTQGMLILCLTVKTDRHPSLGSLVAVRGHTRRIDDGAGRFLCQVDMLKDKRRGPGWIVEEWCDGPDGVH